jgi:mannose-6-phosphate isomerase
MSTNETGKIYERPWGTYQTIAQNKGYQAKLITVNPQGRLSLQKHAQRSEHWVVVAGTPTVTLNDQKKIYAINDYIYIPVEAVHRIENLSSTVVQIIEVQVGNYLGEDDIVRIEDTYGRT